MLRAILNKSWQQHPTRHQLYGHLPPITKTIQVRRTRHAGHCWRSRDELIRDVLLWIPTHGRAKAGRPARTYIQQLCEDKGCCPEDLPRAMNDREEWRERVRDIRATSAIWWWWWYIWGHFIVRVTHKLCFMRGRYKNACFLLLLSILGCLRHQSMNSALKSKYCRVGTPTGTRWFGFINRTRLERQSLKSRNACYISPRIKRLHKIWCWWFTYCLNKTGANELSLVFDSYDCFISKRIKNNLMFNLMQK